MKSIDNIKNVVSRGYTVHWMNEGYGVKYDNANGFYIEYIHNGHIVGLNNDYDPSDFFIDLPF